EDEADDYPADEIPEDDLQKGEVGVVSEAGDADDRQGAGLGSDDGESDRPPRDVAIGEKVVFQGFLAFAKAQPEQGDTRQINSDDREIDMVETHARLPGRRLPAHPE